MEINKEDLQDFVISDEQTNLEDNFGDLQVTTIGVVDQFDFTSEDEFNVEESFEYVKHTKKPSETKELAKNREADNIIKETASKYIDQSYVEAMNKEYDNLRALLKRYDVNSELVKNMVEEDKDKIYGIAEYLFNNFQSRLNDMSFSFDLTRGEWKFLFNSLFHKIEYDQNEVFQVNELREKYLDNVIETVKSLDKSMEDIPTVVGVDYLIILYHIISKYKVKGISSEYYAYIGLLKKIAERIKLYNAYNVWIQRLSSDFQLWGGGLSVDEEILNGSGMSEVQETQED